MAVPMKLAKAMLVLGVIGWMFKGWLMQLFKFVSKRFRFLTVPNSTVGEFSRRT